MKLLDTLLVVALFAVFFTIAPVGAGNNEQKVKLASTLTEVGTGEYFHAMIADVIKLVKERGGIVRWNLDIITDRDIVQDLIDAHTTLKGDHITVVVNSYKLHIKGVESAVKMLVDAGVPVHIYVGADDHWKAFLAEYVDENGDKQTLYVGGSSNTSKNALGSIELDPFFYNYDEMYDKVVAFFEELWGESYSYERYLEIVEEQGSGVYSTPENQIASEKLVLEQTPEKPKFMTSKEYDLWGSVVERFKKLEPGDEVLMMSYTFGHPELTEVMSKYALKGVHITLYIDENSISSASDQITKLLDSGVKVLIYATTNAHLMHGKCISFNRKNRLDKKDEKKMVITTSQNAFKKNSKHIDAMVLEPNNPGFFQQYVDYLNKLAITSMPDFLHMSSSDLNKKYPRPVVELKKLGDTETLVKRLALLKEEVKQTREQKKQKKEKRDREGEQLATAKKQKTKK